MHLDIQLDEDAEEVKITVDDSTTVRGYRNKDNHTIISGLAKMDDMYSATVEEIVEVLLSSLDK